MTKYALIVGDAIANTSFDPENEFHPEIAGGFVEVADDVEVGFVRGEAGIFAAPVVLELPEPELGEQPARVLTRLEFLRLFTREERVALAQARATDFVINDFFMMLELAEKVSFGDTDITQGISYLGAKGFLTEARVAEILAD